MSQTVQTSQTMFFVPHWIGAKHYSEFMNRPSGFAGGAARGC